MAITQSISQFSSSLPDRQNDTPAEFSDNVDDFLSRINDHVEEMNTFIGQANSLAAEVSANATSAETYAIEAQASQNASAYSSAATYVWPNTVIGSDGHAYRCISVGTNVSNEDPVGSTTGEWQAITAGSIDVIQSQVNDMEFRSFAFHLMF